MIEIKLSPQTEEEEASGWQGSIRDLSREDKGTFNAESDLKSIGF